MGEFSKNQQEYLLNHYGIRIRKNINISLNKKIYNFRYNNPDKFVDIFVKSKEKKYPIIVKRTPIDSFISLELLYYNNKKIISNPVCQNYDTSGMTLELSSKHFINYYYYNLKYFKYLKNLFNENNIPYIILDYDNDLNQHYEYAMKTIQRKIKNTFKIYLLYNDVNIYLQKQNNIEYKKQVLNWDQFVNELKDLDFYENLWNYDF